MIEDIERGMEDIRGHLKSAQRNPKKRAHELVELLEDKTVLDELVGDEEISKGIKPKHNRKQSFYRAYIVYLFNNFIFDDDDVEIMLVAFNYHPDFKHETRVKYRRDLFARQVYERKHRKGWGDSVEEKDAGLRGEEGRIIGGLSEVLAKLAVKQGGTLDLVKEVLATLENNGAKEDSPLSDVSSATLPPKGNSSSTENKERPQKMPEAHAHSAASATSTAVIQNHVQVIVVTSEDAATDSPRQIPPEECQPQPQQTSKIHRAPVEELFPTAKEITLIPGEIFQLKVAILPTEAIDAPLSFVSLDPSIITVSTSGMLKAEKKPQKLLHNTSHKSPLRAFSGRTKWLNANSQTIEIVSRLRVELRR